MRLLRLTLAAGIVIALVVLAPPAPAQYVDSGTTPVIGTSDSGAPSTEPVTQPPEVQGVQVDRGGGDAFAFALQWPYLYLAFGLFVLFLLLWRRTGDEDPARVPGT